MHFWIDKRSQTCGYSGRHRVPPSLQHANCGLQRRRRRRSRAAGKPMVTPVHRFQPIENTGLGVHSSAAGRRTQQQQQQQLHHHQQRQLHSYIPPTYVTHLGNPVTRHHSGHSAELDSSVFLDIPVASNGDLPSHHQPPSLLPLGTLRCGIWTAFVLASIFVVGSKLYFNNQSSGLEAMGFFVLLTVILLLSGCIVSLRRSSLRWDVLAASVPETHGRTSTTSISHELDVTVEEETSRAPNSPPPQPPPPAPPPTQPELPPPPYHIAILLPQQIPPPEVPDESPPPSYDKAVG